VEAIKKSITELDSRVDARITKIYETELCEPNVFGGENHPTLKQYLFESLNTLKT
jgi:hypothetical protein